MERVNLKFVNPDLAILAGFEGYTESDLSSWLKAFGTIGFVEGRDHSRDGDFAT